MTREENINEIVFSFINFRKGLVRGEHNAVLKLPHAQGEALFCVFHNNEVTVSELAGFLGVTPSAATQLADALVQSSYIERLVDQRDRRVTKLKLSQKGEAALKELKRAKLTKLNQILAPLSDSELETLASLLKKLSQSIQEQGGRNERKD
ncbi:MAG: MarR family transcriptional regulator [Candidatus Saccharimonadales bacterium]